MRELIPTPAIDGSRVISHDPVAIIMSAARTMTWRMHEAFPNAHIITDGNPTIVGQVIDSPITHQGTRASSMQDYAAILEAVRVAKVRAVVTPFETGLPAGAYVRSVLRLPGVGVKTGVYCTDKFLMKRRFRSAGIRTATFLRVNNLQQLELARKSLGGNVVIKPLFGGGSAGVRRLRPGIPVQNISFPVLCERALDVQAEFHIDGIVQNGEVVFSVVSQYGEPMLNSAQMERTYSSKILNQEDDLVQECMLLADRSVQAVRLSDGVFHAEVLLSVDGFYMGEIACRPAGGGIPLALKLSTGIDLQRHSWSVDCGLGETVYSPPEVKTLWHVALPESLTQAQRDHLASIEGHLCTTTPPGAHPSKMVEEVRVKKEDLSAGDQEDRKKVFYSSTNAGCSYFDVNLNPHAPKQVQNFLERV